MSRYVDAEYIKAVMLNDRLMQGNAEYELWKQKIDEQVKAMPSIDIVRCRECKHAHMTYDGRCKYCDTWKDDDGNCLELYLDGDYYCADGEREGE